MKGLYQQRTVTRVQRDRSYSQRSGSMFARVCLRGGSGITTYTLYGCIIPPLAPTIHQGWYLVLRGLFTDVMCRALSLCSLCPSFFKGRRPISSDGSRNPSTLWEENHRRVDLSPYSRRSQRSFNEFVERIDWTWIDQSCVFCVDWHSANIRISNKNFARFLFSRTFQKARCRVSKQDWFIRTISVQSTFNV